MDPVQITMLGVGVALAALIVTMNGSLRRDMDRRFEANEKRFDDRIDGVEKRFGERFDGIEKRFGERFDGIDKRLDGIDRRIDGIEKRFDERFDGIDTRLRSVEDGLSEVKGRLAPVERYIFGRAETPAREAPAE